MQNRTFVHRVTEVPVDMLTALCKLSRLCNVNFPQILMYD